MLDHCPVCDSGSLKEILNFSGVPQYNLNYSKTREEALGMKLESVHFVQCLNCSFVFNCEYTQLDYQVHYDASRASSASFRSYLADVANKVMGHVPGNIKSILEVGAGDCHFAREFIKLQPADIVFHAFDPSWPKGWKENNLHAYNTYYDKSTPVTPDLLIMRHVLEHISDVAGFLRSILYEEPQHVLIEVPCFEYVNKDGEYQYHYFSNEHCSYFTKESLTRMMHQLGYQKVFVDYIFGEEYLLSLWRKNTNLEISQLVDQVATTSHTQEHVFGKETEPFAVWAARLTEQIPEDSIIWGAGGKGVMLSNLLKLGYKKMPYIIDLNPNIWGMFIPGSGIEVASPEILKKGNFKSILILNHLYKKEIESIVYEMGLTIPVVALFK